MTHGKNHIFKSSNPHTFLAVLEDQVFLFVPRAQYFPGPPARQRFERIELCIKPSSDVELFMCRI